MKKISCVIALLAVTFIVSACGDSEDDNTKLLDITTDESSVTVAEPLTEAVTTIPVTTAEVTTVLETTAATTTVPVTTSTISETTKPPVTTTKPVATTTKPPVTTAAPVTTTKPPVITTAPVTTTKPPVTTTAPAVTTAAPVSADGIRPLTATSPKSSSQSVSLDDQKRMLKLVNELRASVGVAPLQLAEDTILTAQLRAEELITDYNPQHNRPDGTLFSSIYKELGITYHYVGENIGMGQQEGYFPNTVGGVSDPVVEFFEAWKGSPSHYKNMISDKYKYFGYGCAYKDGTYYVSQELIAYWD